MWYVQYIVQDKGQLDGTQNENKKRTKAEKCGNIARIMNISCYLLVFSYRFISILLVLRWPYYNHHYFCLTDFNI